MTIAAATASCLSDSRNYVATEPLLHESYVTEVRFLVRTDGMDGWMDKCVYVRVRVRKIEKYKNTHTANAWRRCVRVVSRLRRRGGRIEREKKSVDISCLVE